MIRDTFHRINNRLFGQKPAAGSRTHNTRALAGGRVSMQDPLREYTHSYGHTARTVSGASGS